MFMDSVVSKDVWDAVTPTSGAIFYKNNALSSLVAFSAVSINDELQIGLTEGSDDLLIFNINEYNIGINRDGMTKEQFCIMLAEALLRVADGS